VVRRNAERLVGRGTIRRNDDPTDAIDVRYEIQMYEIVDRHTMLSGDVREGKTGEGARARVHVDGVPKWMWLGRWDDLVLVLDDGREASCYVTGHNGPLAQWLPLEITGDFRDP